MLASAPSSARRPQSKEELDSADLTLLTETHAVNLARMIAQWPDVVQNTFKTAEPTTVLSYLFKMTHASQQQLRASADRRQREGADEGPIGPV